MRNSPADIDWSSSNLSKAWKKFEQHMKLIFAGPLKEKEEKVQESYLLLWIGGKGRDINNIPKVFKRGQEKTETTL